MPAPTNAAVKSKSCRLNVVAQSHRLVLDFVQAMLDQITDRHDADELTIFNNWQVTELTGRHAFHDGGDGFSTRAGDHLAGHHLPDRLIESALSPFGQGAHDIALRDDAGHSPIG